MLDFIKKNKIIVGTGFAVMVLLIIIVLVVLSLWKQKNTVPEEISFGNIDEDRVLTEEELLFGTTSERWATTQEGNAPAPNLRMLTSKPVIAAVPYNNNERGEYVRFTVRTDGNVFETPLSIVGQEEMVSNEKIIRIGNVDWSQGGESSVTQYLDKTGEIIETYLRPFMVSSTTADDGMSGRHLEEHITAISISPKGDKVFYIVTQENGSIGYVETISTEKRTQVWSSLLTNFTSSWESDDMILVYPNPSSVADGALWYIQPSTQKTQVLFKKGLALAAKSNYSGSKILVSKQENNTGTFSLQVLTVATGDITQLGMATMVEKCSWGRDSRYVYCAVPREMIGGDFLEKWYMGIETSDDQLWRLDTEVGTTKLLLDPQVEVSETFDILDITVSPSEDFVIFKTKVASGLWALKLEEQGTENTATTTTQN